MSYSSVEAHAKEYFWSLSPLAKRVASDVAAARDAYEDLWITLSLSDQRQVVDDAIIRPDAALKYSFCPRGRPPVEYFPRLRLQTGGRIVSEEDGKVSWRDEHSAPFSFMTRSQLNLSLSGAEPTVRSSPRKPAEGFLDPPSVVLGGSSTNDSPPPAGFLTRLRNKSAVLKIQALGRPADRQPLISPGSKPTPEIAPAQPADAKVTATKPVPANAAETKVTGGKPVAPKTGDLKAASLKPVAPKPGDLNAAGLKPVAPKLADLKAASLKPVAPKPGDLKAAGLKPVVSNSIELSSAALKPVASNPTDLKPSAVKPVTLKPADPKTASVKSPKPAESKPAAAKAVSPKPVKPTEPAPAKPTELKPGAAGGRGASPKRKPRTPPPPPPGGRDSERARLLPPSPDELEGARLAALQANLSLESLQEFHSALNSPTGSVCSLPKTGFDFLDNW